MQLTSTSSLRTVCSCKGESRRPRCSYARCLRAFAEDLRAERFGHSIDFYGIPVYLGDMGRRKEALALANFTSEQEVSKEDSFTLKQCQGSQKFGCARPTVFQPEKGPRRGKSKKVLAQSRLALMLFEQVSYRSAEDQFRAILAMGVCLFSNAAAGTKPDAWSVAGRIPTQQSKNITI